MPAPYTSTDYSGWTLYRVGNGATAQAMGLVPGSVIAAPAADAGTFYVLSPSAALSHGLNASGPALLAELAAAGDATELTEVVGG